MTTTMLMMVILSAVIHASWNFAAKRTSGDLGVLWISQVAATIVIAPFALHRLDLAAFDARVTTHVALTALIQTAYFVAMSRAYAVGDLSVVYPIARGSGVAGSAAVSTLILGDSLSFLGGGGIGAVCIGCIALGLQGRLVPKKGVFYALLLGATLSAGATNDKLAVGRIDPLVYIFLMYAIAIVVGYPLMSHAQRSGLRETWKRWPREILLIGVGSMVGYLIILFAFRDGPMAYIVAMREMSVVLGSIAGIVILKESLSRRKATGLVAIVTGLMLIKLA